MVASSNKSVLYSQIACNPCSVARSINVRSNLALYRERLQVTHPQPLQLERSPRVPPHTRDLKQGIAAEIAAGSQIQDEHLEGHILIRIGRLRAFAHPCEQLTEARLACEVSAQHQRVQENADQDP